MDNMKDYNYVSVSKWKRIIWKEDYEKSEEDCDCEEKMGWII